MRNGSTRAWCALFALAAAVLVGLVLYNTLRLEGSYTPDSLFYIDAARNLNAGRGLSSSMAELDRLMAADQALPVSFTLWAPMYPLAIAGVALTGIPPTAAAFVVAVVAYGGVLFAAFLLAQRMAGPVAGALAVGLLAHLPPLLMCGQTAWSETLGLTFLLLSLWLLARPRSDDGQNVRQLLEPNLAGVLAGLAFATRYALGPIVVLGPAVYLAQRGRSGWRQAAAFGAGGAVAVLPVALRNFTRSGIPAGGGATASEVTFADIAWRALAAMRESYWQDSFLFRAIVVAMIIAVGASVVWQRIRPKNPLEATKSFWPNARVLASWAALYLAFLLVAQLRVRVDPLNVRLLLPVLVVVPPLVAAALVRYALPQRVAAGFAAVLLAVAIVPQANNARLIAGMRLPPVYDVAERIPAVGAIAWLAERVQPHDFIIAEDGLDLPFYLGP
ncbi:MAG: glycosyltransferase family 39 protein, partial [Candidatus Hydrogenedentales bacterium]